MQLMKDRTQEIKKELAELYHTLKMSVQKAIRIGQLLTEQKEFVGHGLFLNWLDANLDISVDTASRYMKLYAYNDKIRNLPNLQTAYKQIETLEAQQKQSEEERKRFLIAEFRRTGQKPAGWDRSLDYRIKKDDEALPRQKERIEKAKQECEERAQQYKESHTYKLNNSPLSDALKIATEAIIAKSKERQDWKEKIRLSDGGKEDSFMDAIIDYLETLESDNSRIEACNNIIKICRNISIELQQSQL